MNDGTKTDAKWADDDDDDDGRRCDISDRTVTNEEVGGDIDLGSELGRSLTRALSQIQFPQLDHCLTVAFFDRLS